MVVREHTVGVLNDVGAPGSEQETRCTEAGSLERIFVAVRWRRRVSLACSEPRPRVPRDQCPDLGVRDRWMTWADGLRSTGVGVNDQSERSARLEDLVDALGRPFPVRPLERLPERHEAKDTQIEQRDVFGSRFQPQHIADAGLTGERLASASMSASGSRPTATSKNPAS